MSIRAMGIFKILKAKSRLLCRLKIHIYSGNVASYTEE